MNERRRGSLTPSLISRAAKFGHQDILEWFIVQIMEWPLEQPQWMANQAKALEAACSGGQLHIIEWLMALPEASAFRGAITESCMIKAASGGHWEVIRWLRAQDCPWDATTTSELAKGGHWEILKWARGEGCGLVRHVGHMAAKTADVETLKWVVDHGAAVDDETYKSCFANTHNPRLATEGVQWLYARGGTHKLGKKVILSAVQAKCFAAFSFLFDQGCEYSHSEVVRAAVVSGQKCILEHLKKAGVPATIEILRQANVVTSIPMLEWVLSEYQDLVPCAMTAYLASSRGRLDVLKKLHARGVDIDEMCMREASNRGHIEVMRYLHCRVGISFSRWHTFFAAGAGHLHALRYLHHEGCPWDEETCAAAASNGHLRCLEFLREHGCPWDATTTYASQKLPDVHRWVVSHGCPSDTSSPSPQIIASRGVGLARYGQLKG